MGLFGVGTRLERGLDVEAALAGCLGGGATNSAFNWAVASGDVVRVVLLFYLMPLWAAVLARWLLQEALTAWVWGRVALAMGGALVILWPASGTTEIALPWPSSLADGLGLAGGFFFALNNVLLRREAESSGASRALSMFFGDSGGGSLWAVIGPCRAFALVASLGLAMGAGRDRTEHGIVIK